MTGRPSSRNAWAGSGRLDGRFAVYLLAVHPWHRRAGLGRELLSTLISATKTGAW